MDFNTTQAQTSMPVFVNGRWVGAVTPQGDFEKRLNSTRHFLKRPILAIAFDIGSLRRAQALGAWRVVIYDLDTGAIYQVALGDIWAHGFTLDRGHGVQIALPLRYWRRNGGALTPVRTRPNPPQPTIFDALAEIQSSTDGKSGR